MKETFEIIVNPPEERLDLALLGKLRERMPDLSRLAVKKLFAERKVLVNGKIANASLRLKPGRYPVELVNFDEGAPLAGRLFPSDHLRRRYAADTP